MLGSDVNLSDCSITDCSSGVAGGGVWAENGSLTIVDTQLVNNTLSPVFAEGGGLSLKNIALDMDRCTLQSNRASGFKYAQGGGIRINGGTASIDDTLFLSNCADGLAGGIGGGLWTNGGVSVLTRCRFEANRVSAGDFDPQPVFGGGAALQGGSATFTECYFLNNKSESMSSGGTPDGTALNLSGNGSFAVIRCALRGNTTTGGNPGFVPNLVKASAQSSPMIGDTLVCGNDSNGISTFTDLGGNTIASDCCLADQTGPWGLPDGTVDALDMLRLIAQWGSPCSDPCDMDIAGPDGNVDSLDFLLLISEWGDDGPCSQ